MIGGLLRFAPGRLGARKHRAPSWCWIRRWVVSWLPCVTPETSWNPSPHEAGRAVLSGRDGNRQRDTVARCVSRGWLIIGRFEGRLVWAASVKSDGKC